MKQFFLTFSLFVSLITGNAQTLVFSENFDNPAFLNQLPTGWSGTPDGFFVQNTNPSDTAYTGASGSQNLVVRNDTSSSGTYTVQTPAFNVNGFDLLQITYGVRNSNNFQASGSAISGFEYSLNNGGSWNTISYTNNPTNSTWSLVNNANPISVNLPSGASTCILRWTANITNSTSGTYRIDDVNVLASTSASTYTGRLADVGIIRFNSLINDGYLQIESSALMQTLRLYDLTGKLASVNHLHQGSQRLDVGTLPKGLYFLEVPALGCLGKIIIQ